MKKRHLVIVLAALAAVSTGPTGSLGLAAGDKKPQPTKGWNAPVLVHADQSHRETSLAISPKNPKLMIACAPSGVPNTSHKQSYFHMSKTGGKTWQPTNVEGGQTDGRNYTFEGGDCDVNFDKGGTLYSADTWLGNLSIGHSTDGGKTWEGTPLAATGLVVDRPWLVGGPKGTVHVSYQDLQCCMPSAIWYTRSTDYGQTFQPTSLVASAGQDGAFTWQGNLVVSPSGKDLYLAYTRRGGAAVGSLDEMGPEKLYVAVSHDSGQSWKSNLVVAMPNPMSYLYPSIALDRRGNLHIVFSSMTEKDRPIWYTSSRDRGETWKKPIPLSRGAAGYSPWIDTDERGNAAVVWYGSPDPAATPETNSDWYFYWARISKAATPRQRVKTGRTTKTPLYSGRSDIPEFEMVRLDAKGRMHIGASAFYKASVQANPWWAIYYQRER